MYIKFESEIPLRNITKPKVSKTIKKKAFLNNSQTHKVNCHVVLQCILVFSVMQGIKMF
jgi:hypothetical protein